MRLLPLGWSWLSEAPGAATRGEPRQPGPQPARETAGAVGPNHADGHPGGQESRGQQLRLSDTKMNNKKEPLLCPAQWIECRPVKQEVPDSIQVRAHAWDPGRFPVGDMREATN